MLRLTAWISLVIGALSTVLFIGELANGNTSEAPTVAIVAGFCIFTGLLFLALAALLRWVQLIEWRLGLRADSPMLSHPSLPSSDACGAGQGLRTGVIG
jgi:hypothetical protein